MTEVSLAGPLAAARARCIRAFHELADTLGNIEESREDGQRLREIAADLGRDVLPHRGHW